MNNEKIISDVLEKVVKGDTSETDFEALKNLMPDLYELYSKDIKNAISLTLQEAQKQKDEEINTIKEEYNQTILSLKSQLSEVNKIWEGKIEELRDKIRNLGFNMIQETDGEMPRLYAETLDCIIEYIDKNLLAKGDVHTQRTKVTEPLDKADESGSRISSAPKDERSEE